MIFNYHFHIHQPINCLQFEVAHYPGHEYVHCVLSLAEQEIQLNQMAIVSAIHKHLSN